MGKEEISLSLEQQQIVNSAIGGLCKYLGCPAFSHGCPRGLLDNKLPWCYFESEKLTWLGEKISQLSADSEDVEPEDVAQMIAFLKGAERQTIKELDAIKHPTMGEILAGKDER